MKLVTIKTYVNEIEANIAKSLLESCGIEAFIIDNYDGFKPTFQLTLGVRLAVHEEDSETATKILEEKIADEV